MYPTALSKQIPVENGFRVAPHRIPFPRRIFLHGARQGWELGVIPQGWSGAGSWRELGAAAPAGGQELAGAGGHSPGRWSAKMTFFINF